MANEEYELLKGELSDIAAVVEKYPQSLQQSVFELMVQALLGRSVWTKGEAKAQVDEVPEKVATEVAKERNYVAEFKSFVAQKDPNGKLNDLEFAAVSAYFFANEAPPDKKTQTIDRKQLLEAIAIAGRKPPSDPNSTLSNAKRKRYLDFVSTGMYQIAPAGSYFVEHELPKQTRKK